MFGLFESVEKLTVKNSTAILSGGGQRFACGVQFISVVSNADLELNGFSRFLKHTGTVEHGT